MARGKKKVPDINSSSTADIAFLLLIFFLITTSMDTDQGLARRLPPPPEQDQEQPDDKKFKKRNVLTILINKHNQLMVGGEIMDVRQLRDKTIEFIDNPNNDPTLPAKKVVNIELLGDCEITDQHLISLQNDRGTSYEVYIDVQNELVAAYNELRDKLAKERFQGKTYKECTPEEQKAVRKYYPQRISEAEPKNYGGK